MSTPSPSQTIGAATAPSLADIAALVAQEMELVEEWLQSNLIDDNPFIAGLLSQVFQSGGKRLRPLLVLLSSKASARKGRLNRLHIILAVLTELIHTASLVHDDVIDRASVRRGNKTVNAAFNDRVAVLLGDLLFAQASICLARLMNPTIVGIYGQVLGDLCAGEIKQLNQHYATQVDWQAYISKSVCKTASLFSAGCHSGPILNGSSMSLIAALREYGLNLGILFQISDDLLDVTGTTAELGKPAGNDLAQGVITAPAMFILDRGDSAAQALAELIKSRAVTEPAGLKEALKLITNHGGVECTQRLICNYADKARSALAALHASAYKDALSNTIEYLVTRTH